MRKKQDLSIVLLCAFLLSLSLLVTGCGNDASTAETEVPTTSDSETPTVSETVAFTEPETSVSADTQPETSAAVDTEPQTESQTETEPIPEESLNIGDPTVNSEIPLSEIYHVKPTQSNGSQNVSVSDVNLTINYQSTFYGSESVINRDTYHFAHLFEVNALTAKTEGLKNSDGEYRHFVMGDFVGDRRDEYVMFEDGTLLIAAAGENKAIQQMVYTQSLGIDATVVGTGLFNDDLYADIVLYTAGGQVLMGYGSNQGFDWALLGRLPDRAKLSEGQKLYTGDVNGDGVTDLVLIEDLTVTTYLVNDGEIVFFATSVLPYAEEGQFLLYAVGDINSDRVADVLCIMSDGTMNDGFEYHAVRTYFGRQDGHFGPRESEGNNMNLYATYRNDPSANEAAYHYDCLAIGDADGDGVLDYVASASKNHRRSVRQVFCYGKHIGHMAPAYDYSTHIIKTDDGYILYNGGLFQTYDTEKYAPVGCDHPLVYTSKDGRIWHQNLDGACIVIGGEVGMGDYSWGDTDPETGLKIPGTGDSFTEKWWIGNTIEPEVIRDPKTGIYYMFTQTENYCFLEDGVTPSGADRIGVSTSTDGNHFERKIDKPVIVTDDIYSGFTHQQVIYVPDDPEGKCWWLNVSYRHKNGETDKFPDAFIRRILIRSDDPTCFDMTKGYEFTDSFGSHGNQMGYISNYDGKGNRLFVAVTLGGINTTDYQGNTVWQTVPTLIVSTDGINWVGTDINLAAVDLTNPDEAKRPHMYFLGMSTLYGTGEIYKNEKGEYEFIYAGCTSTSPLAPEIFQSEVGMGVMTFTLEEILPD